MSKYVIIHAFTVLTDGGEEDVGSLGNISFSPTLIISFSATPTEMAPSVMPPLVPQSPSGGGGTTTIGTIALNSGATKLVIAILRCGGGSSAGLAVKLIELEPDMAHLGESLEEAAELLRAHDQVIESLQSKQAPVEDLLRQADDLIADQRPKAEVYTAMAESLGQAWKDLNNHLDERKTVLTANFNFQGHFQVRRASCED